MNAGVSPFSPEVRFEHLEPTGMRKTAYVVDALVYTNPGIARSIMAGNGFKGDLFGHKQPSKRDVWFRHVP
jgi:hypothetical protein